ncbi:DUF1552 domain-containing protein [Verrucomicrobiales bacterium BCK34]|nr:DUF1552 domain-containing protein [Verrucomicrobiales bacterium BCK34]
MIKRRHFLKGAGISLALPALELYAEKAPESPKRIVCINMPLGFHPPNFFPTNAGTGYKLSPYLKPVEDLRDRFTVISGVSHPEVDGGHEAEASFLTAAPHPASRGFKNTISLDQYIAGKIGDQTRHASLTVGRERISWTATGVEVPGESRPDQLFAKLFLTGSQTEISKQKQQLQNGHSILDVVRAEAESVAKRASRLDREKLDQYFTAVRETENRLTKAQKWLDTPKPAVDEPVPKGAPRSDVKNWLREHFQVIRLALQTDSTRVVALAGAGHSQVPPLPGVTMGYHALTHHGQNPDMISQLEIIEREMIYEWAEFIRALKSTPDGEGTLLDATQVMMGSNLGSASGHITKDLPILLAGGSWKHGQHLKFEGEENYPFANLFVSMMQQMGLKEETFATGKSNMTGLI